MINKPKYLSPCINLQESVIDTKDEVLNFSCIVDGNEPIYSWAITIYRISDNEIVLNTGKQSLNSPFYPIDNKNRNVVFKKNIKEYMDENSYLFVNSSEAYYWKISFWNYEDNNNTEYNEYPTITSSEAVFFANLKPTISFQYSYDGISYSDYSSDLNISSKECYFKAIYTQAENISIKRYGWKLIDTDTNHIIFDTISKNKIYGTSGNITCSYDGFSDYGKYSLTLFIETQNGYQTTENSITFSSMYETVSMENTFEVSFLENEAAVMLNWEDAVIVSGEMFDNNNNLIKEPSYKENYPVVNYDSDVPNTSVVIPNDYLILYNYNGNSNLDIDENCYVVLSTQLIDNIDTTLFEAEGIENGNPIKRRLTYNSESNTFIYSILDSKGNMTKAEHTVDNIPGKYVWYIITLSPIFKNDSGEYVTELKVSESIATGG